MLNSIYNKTMDFNDLKSVEAKIIINDLNNLIKELRLKELKISSWCGVFDIDNDLEELINRGYYYQMIDNAFEDKNFPWFLYWEITWLVLNNAFLPGQKVLDLGGSSSLFSFYLASLGLEVTTIDINKELVDNANQVSEKMNWRMTNKTMDMKDINFDYRFDHITSVCVFEHIPLKNRIEICKKIKNHLASNGKFSITFDYRNPSEYVQINNGNDVYEQFIKPSGLEIRGNEVFYDNNKNYLLHPFYYKKYFWKVKIKHLLKGDFNIFQFLKVKNKNDYTFGSLFLEKNNYF